MVIQIKNGSVDAATKIGNVLIESNSRLLRGPQAVFQVIRTAFEVIETRTKNRKTLPQKAEVLVQIPEALVKTVWDAVNMI